MEPEEEKELGRAYFDPPLTSIKIYFEKQPISYAHHDDSFWWKYREGLEDVEAIAAAARLVCYSQNNNREKDELLLFGDDDDDDENENDDSNNDNSRSSLLDEEDENEAQEVQQKNRSKEKNNNSKTNFTLEQKQRMRFEFEESAFALFESNDKMSVLGSTGEIRPFSGIVANQRDSPSYGTQQHDSTFQQWPQMRQFHTQYFVERRELRGEQIKRAKIFLSQLKNFSGYSQKDQTALLESAKKHREPPAPLPYSSSDYQQEQEKHASFWNNVNSQHQSSSSPQEDQQQQNQQQQQQQSSSSSSSSLPTLPKQNYAFNEKIEHNLTTDQMKMFLAPSPTVSPASSPQRVATVADNTSGTLATAVSSSSYVEEDPSMRVRLSNDEMKSFLQPSPHAIALKKAKKEEEEEKERKRKEEEEHQKRQQRQQQQTQNRSPPPSVEQISYMRSFL